MCIEGCTLDELIWSTMIKLFWGISNGSNAYQMPGCGWVRMEVAGDPAPILSSFQPNCVGGGGGGDGGDVVGGTSSLAARPREGIKKGGTTRMQTAYLVAAVASN